MKRLVLLLLTAWATTASGQVQADPQETPGYREKIRTTGDLYYGIEHTGYPPQLQGSAYFLSPDWQKGTVTHKGVTYTGVHLKYDLVTDELIVLHPNNVFAVTLYSPAVDSFSVAGQRFIYVPENNTMGLKRAGFYQELATGRITILAKRTKIIEEKTAAYAVEKKIDEKDQFFALVRGTASPITSEESLLQYTGDMARKIRLHLRDKQIRFRKQKELAILESVLYYNQLAH